MNWSHGFSNTYRSSPLPNKMYLIWSKTKPPLKNFVDSKQATELMEEKKLKTVIIDDSEMHRNILKKRVQDNSNLILIGCYRNAIEAKNSQCEKMADLIILDIEMPFVNGFDLLESFKEKPQIIIVSGRADYALKAFEYNVTDYLLKPIEPNRFNMAVRRAVRNTEVTFGSNEEHIFVRSNFRKIRVDYKDIQWIEALGDYIKLITEKKNILVLTSMKAFEERLPDDQFLRIHKSYIINLKRIEKFNNTVVEVCGKQMPLSRKRKAKFMSALQS